MSKEKIDLVKVKKMFELEDELQKKLDDSLKHSITEGESAPDLLKEIEQESDKKVALPEIDSSL
ncbi:MAG: hypothetical protein KDD45_10780 [Bdellovibrionales bacterium]|nr:hypothetical protein [Bdellovibrionales bacterium]